MSIGSSRLWNAYAVVYDLGVTRLAPYRQLRADVLSAARREADRMRGAGARDPLRLLDLCCGTGNHLVGLLRELGEVSAIGVDLSPAMLRMARRKCRRPAALRWLCGDAKRALAALPAACFDLVVMCNSFYPQPRKAELLAQVRRVLQPGGAFILTDLSAGASLWRILGEHLRAEGLAGLYVLPFLFASSVCGLFVLKQAAEAFLSPERARSLLDGAGLSVHCQSRTYGQVNYLFVARPV